MFNWCTQGVPDLVSYLLFESDVYSKDVLHEFSSRRIARGRKYPCRYLVSSIPLCITRWFRMRLYNVLRTTRLRDVMTDGFGVLCSELRRENFRGHVNDRVKHMICMNGEQALYRCFIGNKIVKRIGNLCANTSEKSGETSAR